MPNPTPPPPPPGVRCVQSPRTVRVCGDVPGACVSPVPGVPVVALGPPSPKSSRQSLTDLNDTGAALVGAAAEGDRLALEALLEIGGDVNAHVDGRTALHVAAEEGHLDCVQLLLDRGANINRRDSWGNTALQGAVHNLQNDCANLLRDKGGRLSFAPTGADLRSVTHRRQCRQWYDSMLVFCGVPPGSDVAPLTGLAGYLYVQHGLNAAKHTALAQELLEVHRPTSRADRAASEHLARWADARESWPALCTVSAPLRHCPDGAPVHLTPNTLGRAGSTGRQGKLHSSFNWCKAEGKCCDDDSESVHSSHMPSVALDPKVKPAVGISDELAVALHERFGKGAVYFADLAQAITEQDQDRSCQTLRRAVLGRLQIRNWGGFIESLVELASAILATPNDGRNADYIPELAEEKVDPEIFSVSVCSVDGQQIALGDDGHFTIQSCGKPFVYAQAVEEYGLETVHQYVGREPSGRAFNDFTLTPRGQPFNAVTNAGAIMVASMFHPEETLQDRTVRYLARMRAFTGGEHVDIDENVYRSEMDTAYRNHAIANFMMSEGCFPEQVNIMEELERHVSFYLRTCSVRVTSQMLANAAATLANYGESPLTREKTLSFQTVKSTLQLAYACGMYNFSGEWACIVGIPAKSGVSGAIWLAVPGVLGVCVRSPRLDSIGNSVRGVRFSRRFAERFQWGVMDLLYRFRDMDEQC